MDKNDRQPIRNKLITYIVISLLLFIVFPLVVRNVGTIGSTLLILIPFAIGINVVFVAALWKEQDLIMLLKVMGIVLLLIYLVSFILAGEGVICIIIYSVIIVVPYFFGVVVGYVIQKRVWAKHSLFLILGIALLTSASFPNQMSANKNLSQEILIHAPKEKVWQVLQSKVAFGTSNDFFFRSGVSYPMSMQLKDNNENSFLHCDYNNGVTDAQIVQLKKGEMFRFKLNDSLISMKEKSIYNNPQTMHVKNYFVVNYGEFNIRNINDQQCILIATTNYKHKFKPESYADFWVQLFVNRLHKHVLTKIKTQAES